ncbi:hypothetical protein BD779DRAFT_694954 [Infundibulicybe gibba]|nr:hypothetical protein BD779DRAFT_694954 [Infundibulicybe gibba]
MAVCAHEYYNSELANPRASRLLLPILCILILSTSHTCARNLTPPRILRMLELASVSLSDTCRGDSRADDPDGDWVYIQRWLHLSFAELIDLGAVGLISALQTLPDFATIFCPGLYYLHHGLDWLNYRLHTDRHPSSKPIPHYQEFLEIIYSRLLQDPLTSRVVPVVYAMFQGTPPETIARLLGLAPEVLYQSAAMQGLFGIGLWAERCRRLPVSHSLGVLLKMGRVKLRAQPGQSGYIDDYMRDAHEYLAFSCAKHLALYTGPEEFQDDDGSPGWYAKRYWSHHLRRAKPSERLFETLRQVDISECDTEPVIQWLEANFRFLTPVIYLCLQCLKLQESPNIPVDILARWHAARRVDPGITDASIVYENSKPECHLDKAFQDRLDRLAWEGRNIARTETESRQGQRTLASTRKHLAKERKDSHGIPETKCTNAGAFQQTGEWRDEDPSHIIPFSLLI